MKSFYHFLTEAKLSTDQALKILGLKPGFTAAELKSAFKAAARKAHPDYTRDNGEAMKLVNMANDVLERMAGQQQRFTQSRNDRAAEKEREQAVGQVVLERLNELFKIHAFTAHFSKVYGQPFSVTKDNSGVPGSYVQREVEWSTTNRDIFMRLSLGVGFSDMLRTVRPLLATDDTMLNTSFYSTILVNNRTVKLTQSSYRMDKSVASLQNPEVMFPAKKLTAQSAKATTRKASKRDFFNSFHHTLGGNTNGDYTHVPVGNYRVVMYRMTFGGAASWSFNGVYEKHSRVLMGPHTTFYEDDATLNFMVDNFKKLQARPPNSAQGVYDRLQAMVKEYKDKNIGAEGGSKPLKRW